MSQSQGASALVLPARINWQFFKGVLYEIEATDEFLLSAGVVLPEQLPGVRPRSYVRFAEQSGVVSCSRLANGNARVTAFAQFIISRDSSFKRFLGDLLSDKRLSLVRDECRVRK